MGRVMSTNRRKPYRYQVDHDAEGRPLCRWCHEPVPKGRRTFCSDGCVHEYRIRSDPGYVRHCVYQRDHGVCAECGQQFPPSIGWEADHIIPVSEGGGECGLENYRTLCIPCHRQETATLAKRRAAKRKGVEQMELPLGEVGKGE